MLFTITAMALASCAHQQADSSKAIPSAQDYFFYACVNQFARLHGAPAFDGSEAYAVEYSQLAPADFIHLHAAATSTAKTIPAPHWDDPEHGLPPVLVICRHAAAEY